MSRTTDFNPKFPHTRYIYGGDHALGSFLDITDDRFAGHPNDPQGEGYVFEVSSIFGISNNLIGAEKQETYKQEYLQPLVEKFIASLPPVCKECDNEIVEKQG